MVDLVVDRQVRVPVGLCQRGMAFVIDSALLAALHFIFFLVLGFTLAGLIQSNMIDFLVSVGVYLVFFLFTPFFLILFYSVVFHACGGQTVGKIIMGIRLVLADGGQVSAGVAFLRWVGAILSFVPFGAGFFWIAISKDGNAWHDVLAGTMVVSAEQTS